MKQQSNDPADFPVFCKVNRQTFNKMVEELNIHLKNASAWLAPSIDVSKIEMSEDMMLEIMDRVQQYRVYFHVFHEGHPLGEVNEGALYCFWIARLHPFSHPDIRTDILNTKIAIYFFANAILFYGDNHGGTRRKIPKHFIHDFGYSLLFRDMTKRALMTLAGSFIYKPEESKRRAKAK